MNKYRNKITSIFFVLSLVFALSSLSSSGALSQGRLERSTTANITEDTKGLLELEGFNNHYVVDLDKDYTAVGSITNNAKYTINLIITTQTDFSLITNRNLWQGIKIGEFVREFTFENDSSARFDLLLEPGQTIDIQIAISHNQSREIITAFDFLATDMEGLFIMELKNTINAPRQITYK